MTLWPALLQLFAVVVITYVTLMGNVVVLVNTSLIDPLLPLPPTAPLMPETPARVQLNVAPLVKLVALYTKLAGPVPLQIGVGLKVLLNTGVGLTVIVTSCVAPVHPL